MSAPRFPTATRNPQCPLNGVRTASTHVSTLFVHLDDTVRIYELVGAQLKELIKLPPFPGCPRQIVMDAAGQAIIVRDYNKDELFMSNADAETWTAWRQLTRSHTDKLYIWSLCMPTPNMLLIYDDKSHSVKQYELSSAVHHASQPSMPSTGPIAPNGPGIPPQLRPDPRTEDQLYTGSDNKGNEWAARFTKQHW